MSQTDVFFDNLSELVPFISSDKPQIQWATHAEVLQQVIVNDFILHLSYKLIWYLSCRNSDLLHRVGLLCGSPFVGSDHKVLLADLLAASDNVHPVSPLSLLKQLLLLEYYGSQLVLVG